MTGAAGNQRDRAALDRLIRGFQISRMIRLARSTPLWPDSGAVET